MWDDVPENVRDKLKEREPASDGAFAIIDTPEGDRWYFDKVRHGWNCKGHAPYVPEVADDTPEEEKEDALGEMMESMADKAKVQNEPDATNVYDPVHGNSGYKFNVNDIDQESFEEFRRNNPGMVSEAMEAARKQIDEKYGDRFINGSWVDPTVYEFSLDDRLLVANWNEEVIHQTSDRYILGQPLPSPCITGQDTYLNVTFGEQSPQSIFSTEMERIYQHGINNGRFKLVRAGLGKYDAICERMERYPSGPGYSFIFIAKFRILGSHGP